MGDDERGLAAELRAALGGGNLDRCATAEIDGAEGSEQRAALAPPISADRGA